MREIKIPLKYSKPKSRPNPELVRKLKSQSRQVLQSHRLMEKEGILVTNPEE